MMQFISRTWIGFWPSFYLQAVVGKVYIYGSQCGVPRLGLPHLQIQKKDNILGGGGGGLSYFTIQIFPICVCE